METVTDEEAKQNLLQLISYTQQNGQHIRITSEEGNVVLLSEETYHNLVVTLELLATPGLLEGIKLEHESKLGSAFCEPVVFLEN